MEASAEIIRNAIEQCSTGNFTNAINYIKSNPDEKITKIALQIIIACCKASTSKKETVSENDLLYILHKTVPLLDGLNGNNRLKYLQSIYHITNFFIYKGSSDVVVQMKRFLVKDFDENLLTDAEKNIYHQIAKLLHTFLYKSGVEDHNFYKISILIVEICGKFINFVDGLHLSTQCFNILSSIKVGIDYQIQYFKTVLSCLNFDNRQKCKTAYINFQLLYSGVLSNALAYNELQKGIELFHYVNQFLSELHYKEYNNLQDIYKFFFVTNHSEVNKSIDGLQTFLLWNDDNECRKSLNVSLMQLWKSFKEYYNINTNKWIDFTEEIQLLVFKFVSKTKSLLLLDEFNDINDITNNNTEILNSLLFYMYIIVSLIRSYINFNKNNTIKYHLECLNILKMFCKDLKIQKYQKVINDTDFIYWKYLSVELCNTGLQLYAQKNTLCTKYFLTLLNLYIRLEDIHKSLIKYEILDSTCSALINVSTDEDKPPYISLGVLLCVKNRDFYLHNWCCLKQTHRNQEFYQQLNLVSALESLPEELSHLELEEFDKRILLDLELTLYKRKWQSRVMISNALNELYKLNDVAENVRIVVELFIDMNLPFHEGIHCFLHKILEEYKKRVVSKYNLGVLYYVYYKSCCKNPINQEKSTKELFTSSKYENVNCEDDHNDDTEDEYDDYDNNVIINKYIKLYEYLQLSIYNLESALDASNDLLKLHNILLDTSFEFKLAGLYTKSIKALQLSLKAAQILNEKSLIIKSIGYLIQLALQENIHLLKLADNIIEVTDTIELRIFHYLCKSEALFKSDHQEAYNAFKEAKLLLRQSDWDNSFELKMLKCRFHLLDFKFASLPCSLNMESHNKSLIIGIFLAAGTCLEAYNFYKIDHSHLRCLLLEAFEGLIRTFHNLKNVKEVVSFLVQMIEFTQMKGLPLHFAKFLLYKAYEHLLSNRQDHCENNIKDINKILELRSAKGKTYTRYYSAASPGLKTDSFRLPATVLHVNTCDCFYCNSLIYNELVMEVTRISALVNVKQNKVEVAEDYLQGALKLYEIITQKPNKCSSDFLVSYGYTLLNYSGHLWRTNRKEAAIQMNDKVLTFITDNMLQNVPLYYEVLLQKLGYNVGNIIPKSIPDSHNNLQFSNDTTLNKTPENKESKVMVTVIEDSLYDLLERKTKKIVPLVFSPDLHEVTQPTQINLPTKKSYKDLNISMQSSEKRLRTKTRLLEKTPPEVKNLRSRTKLLTEKLRKQSIKSTEIEGEKKLNRMNLFGTKSDLESGTAAVKKTRSQKQI